MPGSGASVPAAAVPPPAPRHPGTQAPRHPGTQFQNQVAFFGQRNEQPWRDQSAHRVLPAQQRLGPGHAPLAVHLGLVEQHKLRMLEPVVHLGFEQGALVDLLLHQRVKKAQPVAACILGAVHRHVCLPEHLVD